MPILSPVKESDCSTPRASAAGPMVSGYLHPTYARSLSEFGAPRHLPHSGAWILERRIPGSPYSDAMGCYPILACRLRDSRATMSEDEYAQEYECSFEASVRGAIFAREFQFLRDNGRIKDLPWEPSLPVNTAWDLGMGDSTAIWCIQMHNSEARVIDYYESSGEALGHYVNWLQGKPYTYGKHVLPHDAQVRELGTGRSRVEILAGLGVRATVGKQFSLDDGIEAARLFLKRCWFDQAKCKAGLEALQNYRREPNTKTGELRAEPVHDWASHAADAFRYGALMLREQDNKWGKPINYGNQGIV